MDRSQANPQPPDPSLPNKQRSAASSASKHPPGELDALNRAAQQIPRGKKENGPRTNGVTFTAATLAAVLVGVLLAASGRFDYRCQATISVGADVGADRLDVYRQALLDYAWHHLSGESAGETALPGWQVDMEGGSLLTFSLITSNRRAGLQKVGSIAEGFIDHMAEDAARARRTPDEAEQVMAQYGGILRERLARSEADVEAAIAAVPGGNPRNDRDALRVRWRQTRAEFDSQRRQLADAAEEVKRLASTPLPTHGVVSAEARRKATEADLALQQDLKELRVQYCQLKLHMLKVWQDSAGRLDDLLSAGNGLKPEAPATAADQPGTGQLRLARFTSEARHYTEELTRFADAFSNEFATLQQLNSTAYSSEIIEVYQRVRSLLSDFLFRAAERLASMRSYIQTMAEGISDSARHHVLYSTVVRGFQKVQSAHHRFEFAAGALEPADNFHLDAALRGARGLRRRTQHRTKAIDLRLQQEAREHARGQRLKELADAKRLVQQSREVMGRTIDEIVALQEELNLSTELTEGFLKAVLMAEHATSLQQSTTRDLTEVKDHLRRLEADRLARIGEPAMEIVSRTVSDGPVNLGERLRGGIIGAVVTFLALTLLPRWLTRRRQA